MKFESLPIAGEIFIIGYLLAFIISFAITLFLIRFPLKSSSSQITSSGERKEKKMMSSEKVALYMADAIEKRKKMILL